MKSQVKKLLNRVDGYDVICFGGVVLFCIGLYLINPAFGLCALGLALAIAGYLGAK